jgi:hypothetical protein
MRWLMPVISTTCEMEIERIPGQSQPRQKVIETPSPTPPTQAISWAVTWRQLPGPTLAKIQDPTQKKN